MKLIQPVIFILIGVLFVTLYVNNELAYYIHPDYFIFTVVMGVLLIIGGIVGIVSVVRGTPVVTTKSTALSVIGGIVLMAIVFFGFAIPKKSLSPQTAENRGINVQQSYISTSRNADSATETVSLFGKVDTTSYSIIDWITLLSTNPEPSRYVGKQVKLKGFTTHVTNDTFYISRFVITCCAVDAVTLALPSYQLASDPVGLDEWVVLHGELVLESVDGEDILMIQPTLIERIEQPSDPYYY